VVELMPMTMKGCQQLRDELERLKRIERPAIIKAIAEARSHGDLRENAEYHAAKEKQGFIEGRIHDIEAKLSRCRVIDISQVDNNGKVIFGATVTLLNIETKETVIYQIVGEEEANLKLSKISVTSPVARALIGRVAGDEITAKSPKGEIVYEIIRVEYI